jgi:hypothetical protein
MMKPLTYCFPVEPITIPQAIVRLFVILTVIPILAPVLIVLGVFDLILENANK